MYEEYKEVKITPLTIVKKLRNCQITEEEAVKQIEYLKYVAMQTVIKEEMPLDKTDIKELKDYINEILYDRYDIQPKGNAEMVKDCIKIALKQLGKGSDLRKIPKKHINRLKDILFNTI